MSRFTLGDRVLLSIELALTAENLDPLRRQRQDARAASLGMTGAEIDAARRGWSFDVRTSVALALAMAPSTAEARRQRARAARSGITEELCCEIEAIARRHSHGVPSDD
jgi:hypothetical protein